MGKSELEFTLLCQIRADGLPEPHREYEFHEPREGEKRRRWRFDLAWPPQRVAAECEGGVWTRGRHVRPLGFNQDCEKYNTAVLQGWRVLRFTREMIHEGEAIAMLAELLLRGAREVF